MNVVLLTARDPLRTADGDAPAELATELARAGHDVALVLLEDAVTLARADHRDAAVFAAAVDAGVQVLAEQEALARRAVTRIADSVKPTELPAVVDLIFEWSDRQAWL